MHLGAQVGVHEQAALGRSALNADVLLHHVERREDGERDGYKNRQGERLQEVVVSHGMAAGMLMQISWAR